VRAEAREQLIVHAVRIERQLLRVRQRRFLRFAERTILEVFERGQVLLAGSEPRSLRGVRAVSIFAVVDPRDESRHELLRPW
jgi:hypothetical protein